MLPSYSSLTTSPSSTFTPIPSRAPLHSSEESNKASSPAFETALSITLPLATSSWLTPSWFTDTLYRASHASMFLSRCLTISRNSQLPIDARIQLLSQALLHQPSENSISPLNPLQQILHQEKEHLISLYQRVTIQIEAVCARFLPEETHPIGRTPFINGYRSDFYLEILTNVTDWLECDIKLSPEERARGKELQLCLQRTQLLLSLAVQEQTILDAVTHATQIPLVLSNNFASQLLAFIEQAKVGEEFWVPLTCLNPHNRAHYHIILLRFHKVTETNPICPTLWKVSIINIGLGAIVPPDLKEKYSTKAVCQDFEVTISQNLLTLSSLNLLKNTFETPQDLYKTIHETLFNRLWGMGKERAMLTSIGLCATQTWHCLIKDFLKESIHSRLMSFWIAREIQQTRLYKALTGHLGYDRPFLSIGTHCHVATDESVSAPCEYPKGRIPYWETRPSPIFTPPPCRLPAASETLYGLVIEKLSGALESHICQLHVESERKRSLLTLP